MKLALYYGWHNEADDAKLLEAKADFQIDNTPAGLWHSNCNVKKFQDAGIKIFSYIDGSYETRPLAENLAYITAIAQEGCYGVFLDQVSSNPIPAKMAYLTQIYASCKAHNLKLIINPGVSIFNDFLMGVCDFIMTDEYWQDRQPTESESKWLNKCIVISQGIADIDIAVDLTHKAWSRGFRYHYSCQTYNVLPLYFADYMAKIGVVPVPVPIDVFPIPDQATIAWLKKFMAYINK